MKFFLHTLIIKNIHLLQWLFRRYKVHRVLIVMLDKLIYYSLISLLRLKMNLFNLSFLFWSVNIWFLIIFVVDKLRALCLWCIGKINFIYYKRSCILIPYDLHLRYAYLRMSDTRTMIEIWLINQLSLSSLYRIFHIWILLLSIFLNNMALMPQFIKY